MLGWEVTCMFCEKKPDLDRKITYKCQVHFMAEILVW